MPLNCINCGAGIAQRSDADLCVYCQSQLTHCQINAYQHIKKEGYLLPVQFCTQKDCRIIETNCRECKHYSEEKILPEVEK